MGKGLRHRPYAYRRARQDLVGADLHSLNRGHIRIDSLCVVKTKGGQHPRGKRETAAQIIPEQRKVGVEVANGCYACGIVVDRPVLS